MLISSFHRYSKALNKPKREGAFLKVRYLVLSFGRIMLGAAVTGV
jgi:hypothetical protein